MKKTEKTPIKANLNKNQHLADAAKDNLMPLNKYLANAGVCSRREAVSFIEDGQVQVNDRTIKEPGYKVCEKDIVCFKGAPVRTEKKIYILLNKPKDYITTLRDEFGRKSIIDLFGGVVSERIFPVGRLDRGTTGLIIMTNDGAMAQKLSHPSFEVTKIYSVLLDRDITGQDMLQVRNGLMLKDGFIKPDKVYFASEKNRKHIIIQIHSGKNRIVRRIFKHVGYNVVKLERTNYAGLTKTGLKSGYWRFLNKKEVEYLKTLGRKRDE